MCVCVRARALVCVCVCVYAERGQQSITLSRGSDIRTKRLLGTVGDVLYKTWTSVLTGKAGDQDTDFLGLQDGDLAKVSCELTWARILRPASYALNADA